MRLRHALQLPLLSRHSLLLFPDAARSGTDGDRGLFYGVAEMAGLPLYLASFSKILEVVSPSPPVTLYFDVRLWPGLEKFRRCVT